MTSVCPNRFGGDSSGIKLQPSTKRFKGLKNGALLAAAANDFDVLVIVDKGFEYQQNLASLPIAILLIRARTNDIDDLKTMLPAALDALAAIATREFKKISNS